mgnify:CR=1 FL=1
MSLAIEVSTWSKDPSSQVGCIAVSPDKRQFTEGYNGFPKGIQDTEERLTNKRIKNEFMVHAEANCIVNATARLNNWTMYVTKAPCLNCAKIIANSGITRIVCPNPSGSWEDEQIKALSLLKTADIEVDFYG